MLFACASTSAKATLVASTMSAIQFRRFWMVLRMAYILVKEGHFKIGRIGNAIRISKRSFDKYMEVTMDKKEKKSLPEPRTYTVEQIAAMLNIGRTTAYQLVKQEEFRIVRIGNAIRVSKKSFDEWLESLEL